MCKDVTNIGRRGSVEVRLEENENHAEHIPNSPTETTSFYPIDNRKLEKYQKQAAWKWAIPLTPTSNNPIVAELMSLNTSNLADPDLAKRMEFLISGVCVHMNKQGEMCLSEQFAFFAHVYSQIGGKLSVHNRSHLNFAIVSNFSSKLENPPSELAEILVSRGANQDSEEFFINAHLNPSKAANEKSLLIDYDIMNHARKTSQFYSVNEHVFPEIAELIEKSIGDAEFIKKLNFLIQKESKKIVDEKSQIHELTQESSDVFSTVIIGIIIFVIIFSIMLSNLWDGFITIVV